MAVTEDECCGLAQDANSEFSFRRRVLTLLYGMQKDGIPVVVSSGGASALTPEATYPKAVSIPDNADTIVLAANANRKPGSYIQNISAVPIYYNYGAAATAASSVLNPGESIPLGEGGFVFQGDFHMFQASGGAVNVWAVSFV